MSRAEGAEAVVTPHFMRNLLTRVPKSDQDLVATLVRSIP